MSLMNEEGYMVAENVIKRAKNGMTQRQLQYWVTAGYVACWNGMPGSGRDRLFHVSEVPHVLYMDILVNQLGFKPDKAANIAQAAVKCNVVSKGYTWVDENGAIIGLPILKELM